MTGQVRDKNSSFDDDTYKIAYAERKNYFNVRLHYGGELIGNPNFSYEGGKVEVFDYCDADTFKLDSIDVWAFRVGLHYGDFAACVYKHLEIDWFNGLFPLKSGKNVTQFVVFTEKVKFIDVYFIKADNTDLLRDGG
ncbi:hypothetical protein LIER_33440 [Lithospermum erythrorhizon]|uniref:PB1-like domain-containing protein n=1 Tax=Lithospermum erythrorhizon TaxID=34254 RepID=A0AAV3S0T7_LITER